MMFCCGSAPLPLPLLLLLLLPLAPLKQSGSERFGRRRSASKRLLKQSGSERFGRRRSARLQPCQARCPLDGKS